jgi:hypothetical protein
MDFSGGIVKKTCGEDEKISAAEFAKQTGLQVGSRLV